MKVLLTAPAPLVAPSLLTVVDELLPLVQKLNFPPLHFLADTLSIAYFLTKVAQDFLAVFAQVTLFSTLFAPH